MTYNSRYILLEHVIEIHIYSHLRVSQIPYSPLSKLDTKSSEDFYCSFEINIASFHEDMPSKLCVLHWSLPLSLLLLCLHMQ